MFKYQYEKSIKELTNEITELTNEITEIEEQRDSYKKACTEKVNINNFRFSIDQTTGICSVMYIYNAEGNSDRNKIAVVQQLTVQALQELLPVTIEEKKIIPLPKYKQTNIFEMIDIN